VRERRDALTVQTFPSARASRSARSASTTRRWSRWSRRSSTTTAARPGAAPRARAVIPSKLRRL